MKKQGGFTLIELVVVIAILGILAAVALPKFVGLSSEARIAKMQGAAGAVSSAAALIHAKWLAAGSPTPAAAGVKSIAYEGGSLDVFSDMTFGYPNADKIGLVAGLDKSFDYTTTVGTIADASQAACKITYAVPAAAGGAPTIVADNTVLNDTNCK